MADLEQAGAASVAPAAIRTTDRSRSVAPLVVGCIVVAVAIALTYAQARRLTDGRFTYALDDAYIHLAMARTLAENGVWGLTPDSFAGASSSPAWTAGLALLYASGFTSDLVPLALNCLGALALVATLWAWMPPVLRRAEQQLAAILCITFASPVTALVFGGMEQLWFTVATLNLVALASDPARPTAGRRVAVGALACAATGLRYEGLFVAAALAVRSLIRRDRAGVVTLTLAAALVPSVYAVFALLQGETVVPITLLLKTETAQHGTLGAISAALARGELLHLPDDPLVWLLVLAAVAGRIWGPAETGVRDRLVVFATAAVIHASLSAMRWFFRYEAYLVVIGLWALAGLWPVVRTHAARAVTGNGALAARLAVAGLALLLVLPAVRRARDGLVLTPRGTAAIHGQQVQMALLLRDWDPGGAVALNDIGAVSYLTPGRRVVDIFGLGSPEIARLRRNGTYTTASIDEVTRRAGVRVAVIYESVFVGAASPPAGWRAVRRWTIPEAVTASDRTVTFFAVTPEAEGPLRSALDRFSGRLPPRVLDRAIP